MIDNTNIGLTLEIAELSYSLSRLDETVGPAVGKDGSHGSTERLHCGSQGGYPDLGQDH